MSLTALLLTRAMPKLPTGTATLYRRDDTEQAQAVAPRVDNSATHGEKQRLCIMTIIDDTGPATLDELSLDLNIATTSVRRHLIKLIEEKGWITRNDLPMGAGQAHLYRLTPAGKAYLDTLERNAA